MSAVKEMLWSFPVFIMTSPFKGFDEMKYLKRGDMRFAAFILLLAGFVNIMRNLHTGFIVSGFWSAVPTVDVRVTLLMTYSPIVLFCLANWSITTLTDGKGTIKEVLLTYCYSMFPMVICTIIGIVLSNFVTGNEAAFASFFFIFGIMLQYGYLFIGLIMIHEYTFLKAILMVVFTIISMIIITFIAMLVFALFNNVITFFQIVFSEFDLHWR